MSLSLSEIDALLAASKSLAGSPRWEQDGAIANLTAAVESHGALVGGLRLSASTPMRVSPQRGDAALILEGRPLSRLAFNPKHQHANPGRHPIPAELRRLTLPAGLSKLYRWSDNRWWPREGDDRLAAQALTPTPATFHDALTFFLKDNGISGDLPEPPWLPELSL